MTGSPVDTSTEWPLEMAIAWVATGNKQIASAIGEMALARRANPNARLPSLATRLAIDEGLSRTMEAVEGAIYQRAIRGGASHPLIKAAALVKKILVGKPCTGCRADGARTQIPAAAWRSERIVDDRRRGLVLGPWYFIDVPAAAFRGKFRSKRGRRPAGLVMSGHPRHVGERTAARMAAKRKKLKSRYWPVLTPSGLI